LLADESLDFRIVTALREADFEVISVLKEFQGISDKEVLVLARKHSAILITEDSDFGEWIFAHKEKKVGIVFLRYRQEDREKILTALISLLTKYNTALYTKFAVITAKKIRLRELI
jgi:predicted nuclease of predicted toxin-antitoxin system